ncbi:MAG TPA: type II toxin-antitoxin system RelE/ParE family toxin [Thermoanaerobaculia bacterium]|nr:type II toxin-antitoxin system RelE/ParE family toxin [Thermoanaerobaculia bacterium]
MSDFRIFETEQFQSDLRALARAGHPKILEKLRTTVYPQLRIHPHFGPNIRKLKDYHPDTWRYRIGSWRFFYEIDEEERVVFMTAASHRGSAY